MHGARKGHADGRRAGLQYGSPGGSGSIEPAPPRLRTSGEKPHDLKVGRGTAPVRAGVLIAARYRLDRRVGAGSAPEVWRATDEMLARRVMVALVPPEHAGDLRYRHRFQQRARAAAALTHPGIVAVCDHGEVADIDGRPVPYLVMEPAEGETLADRLAAGPLPLEEAVRIGARVAEALAAAHAAGVAHGDLRPANVICGPDGAKVLGFGLPRGPGGDEAAPAADVHAFGVLLTELLTGQRALRALRAAHLPPEIAELCSRCRAGDPRRRPPAAEAHAVLAAAGGRAAPPAGALPAGRRRRFSGGATWTLGLATTVGLTAAAALTSVVLPGADGASGRSPALAGPSSPAATLEPPLFVSPTYATPPQPSSPPPRRKSPSGKPPQTPGPPHNRVEAPPTRRPSREELVHRLSRVREVIVAGRARGEIAPETAAELDHLVTDFQTELAAGRPVRVAERVDLLRTKVGERRRDGKIAKPRAQWLLAAIDAVDPTPYAAPA